jgi:hypothetical protein
MITGLFSFHEKDFIFKRILLQQHVNIQTVKHTLLVDSLLLYHIIGVYVIQLKYFFLQGIQFGISHKLIKNIVL